MYGLTKINPSYLVNTPKLLAKLSICSMKKLVFDDIKIIQSYRKFIEKYKMDLLTYSLIYLSNIFLFTIHFTT